MESEPVNEVALHERTVLHLTLVVAADIFRISTNIFRPMNSVFVQLQQ